MRTSSNQTARVEDENGTNALQSENKSGIIQEERFNPNHDEKGRLASGKKIKSISVNDDGSIVIAYKSSEASPTPHSGNKIINGIVYDRNGKPFARKPIQLGEKEYGRVVSSINEVYEGKYSGKPVCWHYSGDCAYAFENHGFDNYNFFDAISIDGGNDK